MATHCSGEFISNIFTRDKKTADLKIILNIKELNEHYLYFKLNSTENILELVSKDKDNILYSPYSVRAKKISQIFLRMKVVRFVLSPVPRVFTKLMKPTILVFRRMSPELADYMDEISLIGRSMLATQQNIYRQ